MEAYTIKPVRSTAPLLAQRFVETKAQLARDRALFKRLDAELQADIDLTCPPRHPLSSTSVVPLHNSVFGPLERRENRKTLWLLIGTLNLAYPDHDFTALTAGDFVREASARTVLVQLSTALGHLRHAASTCVSSASPPKFSTSLSSLSSSAGSATEEQPSTASAHPVLRQVLDPIIDLDDCEVYSYAPDFESDPHNGESDSEEADSEDDEANMCGGEDDEGLAWPMDGFATPRLHRRRSTRASRPTPSPVLPRGMSTKRSRSVASLSESTGGLLWSSKCAACYFPSLPAESRAHDMVKLLFPQSQAQTTALRFALGASDRFASLYSVGSGHRRSAWQAAEGLSACLFCFPACTITSSPIHSFSVSVSLWLISISSSSRLVPKCTGDLVLAIVALLIPPLCESSSSSC